MKTKKFEKKLTLNKKTVADLANSEMNKANGGGLVLPTLRKCTYSCEITNCDSNPCC
jgi:hypothetical protein